MTGEGTRTPMRWALIVAGLAVLYYGSAQVLVALSAPPHGDILAVWIPSGISVAAMLVFGPLAAVGAYLGSLAFELTAGTPTLAAFGLAAGNASGELVVYLLTVGFGRLPRSRFSVDTTRGVTRFLGATVFGAALSSTLGITNYVHAGVLESSDFLPSWLTFFGSIVMGIVLVTPALFCTFRYHRLRRPRLRVAELALMFAAIGLAAWLWQGPYLPAGARESALVLVLHLFLFSAFQFTPSEFSMVILAFGAAAIWGAAQSVGASPELPATTALFALQLNITGVAMAGILVSGIVNERSMAHDERRLAAGVFESSNDSVIITLPDGEIVDANDTFVRQFGMSRERVLGANPRIVKSDRHDRAFYAEMWNSIIEKGRWAGEVWNRRADGSVLPIRLSISAVKDANGSTSHYVGVMSDITQIKEAEERLVQLATHDALTGLANRALLDEELASAIARARRNGTQVALYFMDLDYFKKVNDTLGHVHGDALLVEVSRRLKAEVRESDTVARHGGDEFVIVAPDISDIRDLEGLTSRLLETIRKPYWFGEDKAHVSLSLGIAVFPSDGEDAETLIKHSDLALYKAKELGRDRSQFFSDGMQDEFSLRMRIENDLREAIATHALFVLYQPQVNLSTGRIETVEALVRWRKPDGTIGMPDDFIAVAEESGLIIPLGETVLHQACEDASKLRAAGFDLRVAVNFSARQFRDADVMSLLRKALTGSNLPADALEVEVTEQTLAAGKQAAPARVAAIRDEGVRISLDDFGTGYSSLKYVRELVPDRLKIDCAFTQCVPENRTGRAVVLSTIALANNLGTEVVAEGVETPEQLRFLRKNGCLHAQGFLFSEPVPFDELIQLLSAEPYDIPGLEE